MATTKAPGFSEAVGRLLSVGVEGIFLIVGLVFLTNAAEASWIDIDTPLNKRTTVSFVDHTTYELVRSYHSAHPNNYSGTLSLYACSLI